MNCKNCGQEVDKLDIICPNCKSRLDDEPVETKETGHIMDVEEFLAFDDEPKVPPVQEKKKENNEPEEEEYEYYDDEDDGGFFGSKALIIILIIILVAAAALAIKFLILNDDYKVVDTNDGKQTGEVVNPDDKDDETPDDSGNEPVVVEPEEPREVNIAEALDNIAAKNENIDVVKYNSQLKYSPSKDYGVYDVNKSKTFDNYWKDVDGKPVYYDEELLGTMVLFNSRWIDYVNKGDKTVFSMVQNNSRADRLLTGFDKEGIAEEFILFEVGDIRKGSSGYYVWAHEKIKVISTEKTEVREYYWIYKLVQGENAFYVADYYLYE